MPLTGKPDGMDIGAIRQIEARNPVIAGGQADPGGHILRRLFDGIAKITLSNSIIASIEMLDPEAKRLVGSVVFDVVGVLQFGGRGWAYVGGDDSHGISCRITTGERKH